MAGKWPDMQPLVVSDRNEISWNASEHGASESATHFGVLVLKLGNFDLPKCSFDAMFRIYIKFHHPHPESLRAVREDVGRIYYDPAELKEYLPAQDILFSNAIASERLAQSFYGADQTYLVFRKKIDPAIFLTAEIEVQGTFRHMFEMMYFPSDVQTLQIKFLVYNSTPADFHRVWIKNDDVPKHDLDALKQPEYEVEVGEEVLIIPNQGGDDDGTEICFRLICSRNHGFHTIAATVPLSMVVVLTPASYAIEVDDISDRLSMGVTLLLSTVAVKFVVAPDVPKVPYPTGLDLDTLVVYCYLLAVILGQVYLKEADEIASTIAHRILPFVLVFLWRSTFISFFRMCRKACSGNRGGAST